MDRKSIIRYVLDLLIVIAIGFGSWSFGKISILEKNQMDINHKLEAVETLTEVVNKLVISVDALVLEQKIQTRIKKYQMLDRWTSSMMDEAFDILGEELSEDHPGLGTKLKVHDIQERHLASMIREDKE